MEENYTAEILEAYAKEAVLNVMLIVNFDAPVT